MSSLTSSPCPKAQSNLESFLHSVTPVVPSRQLPMNNLQQPVDRKENIEYFILGDLWKVYEEWCAYGVGVPVMLSSGQTIVQYYTPYLSAIQLHTNRKEIGGIAEVSSDGLSETNESSSSYSDNSTKTWGSASTDSSNARDSLWPVREWNSLTQLYLQYDEKIPPYCRVPFVDKISEFAETLPELITLKNTELSPTSWMSVVWSPIYHIPFKGKVEDLSTHFLTFHKLSSHGQDAQEHNDMSVFGKNICFRHDLSEAKSKCKSHRYASLPPFGLSTLKMQGNVWINQSSGDYEKHIDLHRAADSWLKQLGVHHSDFDYYKRKNLEACTFNLC